MMTPQEGAVQLVEEIINAAAGTVNQLASDADISVHSIWGWLAGRRNPSTDSLLKLADALDVRSEKLADLAEQLRAVAYD